MGEKQSVMHLLLQHLSSIGGSLPPIIMILAYYLQFLAILLFFWETYLVSQDRAYQLHGARYTIYGIFWFLGWAIQCGVMHFI